jgi:hypothetical protein
MKPWLLFALFAVSACSNPMMSTNLTFSPDGMEVNPTLSGKLGGATVTIDP